MKLTRHNGRTANGKVYSAKHNDRKFDLENADHIDGNRAEENIYWDYRTGYYLSQPGKPPDNRATFDDVERFYYEYFYKDFIEGQNERNEKNRHPERNRTSEDLRTNKKTCPEESIYQIGTMDDHVPYDVLVDIVTEFLSELQDRFGDHVKILDLALHVDEATPHIHERHVFECENQYGELCPQQEKALEKLGFDLPDPDKKPGRYNNRKISFDSTCRVLLFDICKKHGLTLDEEPEYGGRKYLEKQDFIREKQKKEIAEADKVIEQKEEKLSELTMKIEDVETLIDDVSEAAYDKAVDVVTDTVRQETQKEDIGIISDYQSWLMKPERKTPMKLRTYAAECLGNVIDKIKGAMSKVVENVKQVLTTPSVRTAGIESVKTEARESVLEKLKVRQEEAGKQDTGGQSQKKKTKQKEKQNMEH